MIATSRIRIIDKNNWLLSRRLTKVKKARNINVVPVIWIIILKSLCFSGWKSINGLFLCFNKYKPIKRSNIPSKNTNKLMIVFIITIPHKTIILCTVNFLSLKEIDKHKRKGLHQNKCLSTTLPSKEQTLESV